MRAAPAGAKDASRAPRFAALRETIAHGLLHGPAQLRDGPHAGAVAGVVDRSGRPAYAYPEITGYFLQWLAWRASEGYPRSVLVQRAQAAERWLSSWARSRDAPTRIALAVAPTDWRAGVSFGFDLAMVLRGIASATAQNLVSPQRATIDALCTRLEAHVGRDGELDACRPGARSDALPNRWSTRRGAFLAKAAAGVVHASAVLPLSRSLIDAAEATFDASVRAIRTAPHAEAHPALYAAEGVLAMPSHALFDEALRAVAADLASRIVLDRAPLIAESLAHAGAPRFDIVAQALRCGCAVAVRVPERALEPAVLSALARSLADATSPEGALPFDGSSADAPSCVWAAMFAEQALADFDNPARASSLRRPFHVV